MVKRKRYTLEKSMRTASQSYARKKGRVSSSRSRYLSAGARFSKKSTINSIPRMPVNPFPVTLRTTVSWNPPAIEQIPAAVSAVVQFRLNDVFDPDVSNIMNGQPLYLDQLMSSTGPYKAFIVHGWKSKFVIINTAGIDATAPTARNTLECIAHQGTELAAESDTNAELQALPNQQRYLIQGEDQAPLNKKVIYMNGRASDFTTKTAFDSTMQGNFAASPALAIFGTIGLRSLENSNIRYCIHAVVEFDVEFFSMDGAAS